MEEEVSQNLLDKKKWRSHFCNLTRIIYILTIVLEVSMYFVLDANNLILSSKQYYLLYYFIRPLAWSLFWLVLQEVTIRLRRVSDTLKNIIPILAVTAMFGVLAYIHYIFPTMLVVFCIPIFMTVVFIDRRINIIVTALSEGMIFLALYNCIQRDHYKDDSYYIPSLLLAVVFVFVCGCISVTLSRLLKQQNERLIQAMLETNEAKERADEASRTKSVFLSNMSHEIRTPMNAITGMTDVLLREEHSPQETEYLMNIKRSGNALLALINDILDFSKIESGKLEMVSQEYEFMSMLSDLGMIFWNRIGEKDIELIYDIDPKLPLRFYGDDLRIRQIIINLMNNAIKFTDKGYVKLGLQVKERQGDELVLAFSIVDTGQGIREEDLGKLFQSFQQVDTKRNRSKEGTGLGLAISKQLVERMGGEIHVNSTYGEGTEFTFTLRQKVVDDRQAVALEKQDVKRVGAFFGRTVLYACVERLTVAYERAFIRIASVQEVQTADIDILFLDFDGYSQLKEYNAAYIKEHRLPICVLQNPMEKEEYDAEAVVVHKPLYSLNFCQVLQGKNVFLAAKEEPDQFMNFTAPKAEVLLAEDSKMNVTVAKALLRPLNMKIDVAENGRIAVEKVKAKHYDLVLMDHMMPEMDGVEATREIRKLPGEYFQTLPILALTANAVVEAKQEFLNAGMNDFVAKPIELKVICQKLRQWLPKEKIEKHRDRTKE